MEVTVVIRLQRINERIVNALFAIKE